MSVVSTELFVCYPNFIQMSKFLLNLIFVIVSKRISTCVASSIFSFLILKRITVKGTYENLTLAMLLDHLVTDGIFKMVNCHDVPGMFDLTHMIF